MEPGGVVVELGAGDPVASNCVNVGGASEMWTGVFVLAARRYWPHRGPEGAVVASGCEWME